MANGTYGLELIRRSLRLFTTSARQHVRNDWFRRLFPPSPTVLHFLATEVCNSRCIMCNIWQRERVGEISLDALQTILRNPLFQQIQQIDIVGGEPTLHPDLPKIGSILCETLSQLKTIRLVTNALEAGQVIERTLVLAKGVQGAGASLKAVISLDGVREEHDLNRGIDGNFDAAMLVSEALKRVGIPVAIRCTLTPVNCHGADDLLHWCDQNEIEDWVFRLAIESPQFYNQGFAQQYAFTPEQRFHLMMFFEQLIYKRQLPLTHRQFYKKLVERLAQDNPHSSSCDWPNNSITLDMQGQIRFYQNGRISKISATEASGRKLYRGHSRLYAQKRDNCLHEPPDALSPGEIIGRGKEVVRSLYRQRRNRIDLQAIIPNVIHPADKNHPRDWQRVLITGWYGTETTGDKAILGEVLHFVKTHAPDCQIILTTLNRNISTQMQRELVSLRGAVQVDIKEGHKPALIESVDAVIMGGGPLMESQAMEYIWRIFAEANRQHKARIVFGCGVGPLHTEYITRLTAAVLQMTTAGFFRDKESCEYALKLAPDRNFRHACDPAFAYVRRWATHFQDHNRASNGSRRVIGLLRANTAEFIPDQSKTVLQNLNKDAAHQLAQVLETVSFQNQIRIDLLHMNAPWIGGDDRLFNRQIMGFFKKSPLVHIERGYLSLEALLRSLNSADAAVAMRYHGHIFCMALGIPFLSINYTGKRGKVHSLMQRAGYEALSDDWRAIDVLGATKRLQTLLVEREHWSNYLLQQTDRLVRELHDVYDQVFNMT